MKALRKSGIATYRTSADGINLSFAARYEAPCGVCKATMTVGSEILPWTRGGYAHAACTGLERIGGAEVYFEALNRPFCRFCASREHKTFDHGKDGGPARVSA